MLHDLMYLAMNWGYFIAALYVVGGILIYEFLPPFPFKRDIVVALGVLAIGHVFAAKIFHDGIAYEKAVYERATIKEANRQHDELVLAQREGAQAILQLKMQEAATAKLQKDYDELSHRDDGKQCFTPEQLRRINGTPDAKGSPDQHPAIDPRDPHSADPALPSLRLPAAATGHRARLRHRGARVAKGSHAVSRVRR